MKSLEERTSKHPSFQKLVLYISATILIIGIGVYIIHRNSSKKEIPKKEIGKTIYEYPVEKEATEKSEETIDKYSAARHYMVEQYLRKGNPPILDEKVLESMNTVPREKFVLPQYLREAYANTPLPIGYGQTISQPYIVAFMTELLKPEKDDVALEVGTGSGYQAAVLSQIVEKMYTIEIIPPLGNTAKKRLKKIGYDNIEVKVGDGYYGWKEHAPFDSIIVTAASDHIPPPLIKQLKNGGRMAIPVGLPFRVQKLMLVEKSEEGEIHVKNILPVVFVPFVRE